MAENSADNEWRSLRLTSAHSVDHGRTKATDLEPKSIGGVWDLHCSADVEAQKDSCIFYILVGVFM